MPIKINPLLSKLVFYHPSPGPRHPHGLALIPIIPGYCFYLAKTLFGGPKYSYVGSTTGRKKKMSDTFLTLIPKIPLTAGGAARSRGYLRVKGRACRERRGRRYPARLSHTSLTFRYKWIEMEN